MALFCDDVKVGSIQSLFEKLKLDASLIPYRKRTKEFVQVMDRDRNGNPKRDADGNYSCKRKIAGRPEFTVFVPALGHEVRIRWARNQRFDKDKNPIYDPSIITMDPAEDGTTSLNDEQDFVFWFLHPWCKQSPYHQKDSPAYYEYNDHDAQSKTDNDNEYDLITALGYVIGPHAKPLRTLRMFAKGMNVDGVDDMTDEVVRKTLRDIARRDPVTFINKVDSRELIFSGTIQEAVDRKILVMESPNGMARWYLNGKEILPLPYGVDPMKALMEQMSVNYHLYSDEIKASLENKTVETSLSNPKNDEAFEEYKAHEPQQKAELTPLQVKILAQMKEDELYEAKIKKLAALDFENDPNIHYSTKKSYEANKEAVEAYKATLASEEVPV